MLFFQEPIKATVENRKKIWIENKKINFKDSLITAFPSNFEIYLNGTMLHPNPNKNSVSPQFVESVTGMIDENLYQKLVSLRFFYFFYSLFSAFGTFFTF
jgi:hypothetical protein